MMFKSAIVKAQEVLELPVQSPQELMHRLDTPILYGYSPSFLPGGLAPELPGYRLLVPRLRQRLAATSGTA
jgi:hypothetical protein